MYIKDMPLTFEQVNEFIAYDPLTGIFTWKKAPSRRHKAGQVCGGPKAPRVNPNTGKIKSYRYISLLRYQTSAARVAWLLSYGKWPASDRNLQFKDGDQGNLRLDNLKEAAFPSVKVMQGERRRYKMSIEAQRHYGRKRYYGLSAETYNLMVETQGGLCAICKGMERHIAKGNTKPRQLCVDHNHATGEIRGLLCSQCNSLIGHAQEKVEVLLSAIAYLEKYNGATKIESHKIVPSHPSEELH